MLRSILKPLEDALQNFLHTMATETTDELEMKGKVIADSCQRFISDCTTALFSTEKDLAVRRYIHFHQAGITRMSNAITYRLRQKMFENKANEVIAGSCQKVLLAMEELLEFLRQSFYEYFDQDHPVTDFCHAKLKFELKGQWRQILEMDMIKFIDQKLVDLVGKFIDSRLDRAELNDITYRQVRQLRLLLTSFRLAAENSTNEANDYISAELLAVNFNTSGFVEWYSLMMKEKLSRLSARHRSEILALELNLIRNVTDLSESAFEPAHPSVRTAILTRLENDGIAEPVTGKISTGTKRMPLNIPVPQLALFARLFYLEGCFQVKQVAVLLRFLSEHFTTKRQEHVSLNSLGRLFYIVDQTSAAVVRAQLLHMVKTVDRIYFEEK